MRHNYLNAMQYNDMQWKIMEANSNWHVRIHTCIIYIYIYVQDCLGVYVRAFWKASTCLYGRVNPELQRNWGFVTRQGGAMACCCGQWMRWATVQLWRVDAAWVGSIASSHLCWVLVAGLNFTLVGALIDIFCPSIYKWLVDLCVSKGWNHQPVH